ncbi:rho-related GTP-binding protein RhoE-like [Argiope bruennichi]|uniref:Rho-related GTP-binding protein RhoA-B like protein n=1 Tax=Argiope bruennichi TaxID=94029 RepID=A0A8T0EBD5_ARGBR|nr:rho-related GTP-binding protein RhoE-like [Argiope bruennichi]KAF8769960.1 Rho-related GTP-binding protein RhoA-B like protein [Argiope bruennichi]
MVSRPVEKDLDKILKLAGLDGTDGDSEGDTKIVVVGNKGSGKTSFIECFVTEECIYPELNQPRQWRKSVGFGGDRKLIDFVLRELPASDDLAHIRARAYRNSRAVVICYSIADRESWEAIPKWHEEVKQFLPDAKVFVVGNKMEQRKNETPVSRKEGKDMARSIGADKYYEISAYTGKYVPDVVLSIEERLKPSK